MNQSLLLLLVSAAYVLQAVIFIVSLVLSAHERRDLCDRLISENVGDYMRLSDRKKNAPKPCINAHRKAINAFHAKGMELPRKDEA